ncbi:MAG: serine--tRNA ligase [Phototrophicaceae bacterium]|jgi:seryl-tRNA synthetase
MIDITLIRTQPDVVKAQLHKLQDVDAVARIDRIVALDQRRRELLTESETLQASRNRLNKKMGGLRGNKALDDAAKTATLRAATQAIQTGDYTAAEAFMDGQGNAPASDSDVSAAMDGLVNVLKAMSERYDVYQEELRLVETELNENLLWIPNMPHESVPVGVTDAENVAWPPEGEIPTFDFTPKQHWEIGQALGILDLERGIKLHGTRGYVLKGLGSRLQRALISFFLDMARDKGFTEFYVPFLVNPEMLYGSGQFPKFHDTVYQDRDAGFVFIPTSEVALTNLHRDEVLDEAELPLYYCAATPCFRREQISAGAGVRGIKRVHQFEKVEMFKFTTPETSYAELESLTEAACDIARALKLPFRRLEICTGDLGFGASKKYDVELWAPGSGEWLEVSSCSNTEAFQARRANIRFKRSEGGRNEYVHTLNGSGLATPRVMIAIMENYQQADGSIVVPEVLRPYIGTDVIRG